MADASKLVEMYDHLLADYEVQRVELVACRVERDQLRTALENAVRVLDAVLPYVTGYDAVPYQDAVRDARVALAKEPT